MYLELLLIYGPHFFPVCSSSSRRGDGVKRMDWGIIYLFKKSGKSIQVIVNRLLSVRGETLDYNLNDPNCVKTCSSICRGSILIIQSNSFHNRYIFQGYWLCYLMVTFLLSTVLPNPLKSLLALHKLLRKYTRTS